MTVSDNTIQGEALGSLLKNLGKISAKPGKNLATNVTSRALDITANIGTLAASRNPKNVLSTLSEVIIFYHKGKRLYLEKFV